MRKIGRNMNTNDTATISSPIAVGSSTSVVLAPANPNRIFLNVNNDSSTIGVWIKLQSASTDNDKKGIYIGKEENWQMACDNIYTGEVCAIAMSGTVNMYVTEY